MEDIKIGSVDPRYAPGKVDGGIQSVQVVLDQPVIFKREMTVKRGVLDIGIV
jgi:hypothetical protein